MSFDIFLERFVRGEPAEAPRAAVLSLLRATPHARRLGAASYALTFQDGSEAEFSARGLESALRFTGCAFNLHSLGHETVRFIFDVARAGGMAIMPAMEDGGTFLVPGVPAEDLPADFPAALRPIPVASPQELFDVLTKGYGAWSRYRDQVLSRRPTQDS